MTATNDSPEEQPLDAIIVGPAAELPDADNYPYAPRIQPMQLPNPPGSEPSTVRIGFLHFQSPTPARYMVPKRFGMSAILGIMTALAILFGAFRLLNAPPPVYLFFGLQTLVICFAQMFNGKTPRLASSVAGAILVPLFIIPLIAGDRRLDQEEFLMVTACVFIFGVPIGAFLGYLTGTCAAGIFLVMDYLEPFLQGQRAPRRSANA
ncbi:MAG TPA: hypothetical protein VGI40_01555 [Pirellulaceae bacterium]|jgi:hypothetical protein